METQVAESKTSGKQKAETTTTPSPDPKRGLVVKLCEVMQAVGWITKSGHNQNRGYAYVTEADVVAAVREELSKRNVFVFPNIVNVNRTEHAPSKSGARQFITDVMVEWTFVDGDTGDRQVCMIPGSGMDDQDKGLYKSITGSSKYFLLKSFFLPTGDDPEKDSKEEAEEARERGKKDAQAVGEKKIADLKAKMNYEPGIFYMKLSRGGWKIDGDKALLKLNQDVLRPFWLEEDKVLVVPTDAELEELKATMQFRKTLFTELKGK